MAKDLELKLRITADGKVAVEQLERVDSSIDALGSSGEASGKQVADGLGVAGKAGRSLESELASLTKGFIALAGVEGLRQLAGKLIEAGTAAQDLRSRLEFSTGSAEEADRVFADLAQTGGELGLNTTGLVDSFIRLKNLGLDPSREALVAYANVAAATGKTTKDFVEAVADAITGEFERLKEFGIKASVEGDKVALKFRGQTRLIGNDAGEIERALQSIGNIEFAGAVEAQVGNLSTSLDLLGEATNRLMAAMAQDSGAIETATEWAQALTALANAMSAKAVPAVDDLTESLTAQGAALRTASALWEAFSHPVQSVLGLLAKAPKAAVSGLTDLVSWSKNLGDTSREAARETEQFAEGLKGVSDAIGPLTEQQSMLVEQTREFADAAAASARSGDQLARNIAPIAAALAAQAKAGKDATEIAQLHLKTQIQQRQTAAELAQSMGDERGVLEANAEALRLVVVARKLDAQATEQAIERTRELLALQQSSTAAKREEIDQLNRTLAGLQAEAEGRRALVAAAEQQAEIARNETLTYGDQSAALGTLIAQRDRLTQSLAAYTAAQANAVNGALYLAQAQADLAAAEQQLADARARSGGEGQAEELQVYVGLVEQARARVDELTLATQGGAAADATAAQTKAQLAEVNRLIADAARDAAANITLEIQAANRQQEITRARIDLASAEIASRRDLAAARGEAIAAASLEVDLMRQEVEAAKAAAESKREQAALLAEQARLMQVAAEAAGDYSAAQRAQVSAIEDAAELLRIEAEQLDIVARTKREAAHAAAELADQQRILAEAMREAGVVGVESMDEVSGAISRLTDSGQLDDLGDALDEAFRRGALAADEYKQALEEIEAKQDALKKQARSAPVAIDYEQLYAKYGTDTAALKAGEFGIGVDSRQVAQMLAAYEEWLREMGYLTRQARENAAPQAAAPNYAMAPSNVTINVEGILDVNDRATLDSLARKLKPVLGSLDRRGY